MKKSILFFLFLFFQFSFGQNRFYFYVELSSNEIAPSVINKNDGTKEIHFNDEKINTIFNKYVVYNFEKFASFSKRQSLMKVYSIECNNTKLMNDLVVNFPTIFVKVEEFQPPVMLFTPNDYSGLPPYNGWFFETRHLNLINAQNAWNLTQGSTDVVIGINEYGIYPLHEELQSKLLNPYNGSGASHPTGVGGIAAGATNNGVGLSSIGFNCKLAQGGFNELIANNSKVINMSWGSGFFPYRDAFTNELVTMPSINEQEQFNTLSDDLGIVLVAAAGNGVNGNVNAIQLANNGLALNAENYASATHFPASYNNVISVSTVGNWNQPYTTSTAYDNWIDMHKITTPPNTIYAGSFTTVTEPEIFHQHNDSVDIVVPAYRLPVIGKWQTNAYWDSHDQGGWSGTSFSAPIVSGTVGLIFSVNYCLKPKEVESILKLTARNIEDLPENIQFHGKLGGGALDAFKAVEMANEMAKPFGTVNVVDRILYRNWFYKLETAPYEIKMSNNIVKDGAKIKFFAKNNIEITSGDYKPDIGYVDLQIKPELSLNCTLPSNRINPIKLNEKNQKSTEVKLYPNPNTGVFTVTVSQKEVKDLNIELFDVFGKSVYKTITNNSNTEIDIQNLADGIYLVRLTSPEINEILKLIKN